MHGASSRADYTAALLELQLRLQGGASPEEAIAFLQSRGMPAMEARLAVNRIVAKSLKEQRTKAMVWLALALLCFGIASPYVAAVVTGVLNGGRARGYLTSLTQAASLPAVLILAGGWLGYRGLRLLLSRRYASDPDR